MQTIGAPFLPQMSLPLLEKGHPAGAAGRRLQPPAGPWGPDDVLPGAYACG